MRSRDKVTETRDWKIDVGVHGLKAHGTSGPCRTTGFQPTRVMSYVGLYLVLMFIFPGCIAIHVPDPLTAKMGGDDPHQRMEFWSQLKGRPMVANDEAFHALLLYLDENDPAADYAARLKMLND